MPSALTALCCGSNPLLLRPLVKASRQYLRIARSALQPLAAYGRLGVVDGTPLSQPKKLAATTCGVCVTDRVYVDFDMHMNIRLLRTFAIGDIVNQEMLAHKAVQKTPAAAQVLSSVLADVLHGSF